MEDDRNTQYMPMAIKDEPGTQMSGWAQQHQQYNYGPVQTSAENRYTLSEMQHIEAMTIRSLEQSRAMNSPPTPPGFHQSSVHLKALEQQQLQMLQMPQMPQMPKESYYLHHFYKYQQQLHHQHQQHQQPYQPQQPHQPQQPSPGQPLQHSTPHQMRPVAGADNFPTSALPPQILTPNNTPPMIVDESTPHDQLKPPAGSQPPQSPLRHNTTTGPSDSDDDRHSTTNSPSPPNSPNPPSSPNAAAKRAVRDFNESIFQPRLSAKGVPKISKCKQCHFTTTIKADLWKHTVVHINPEKILRCSQCPFVTEYKHHLDFHWRNHTGDKPFHCPQCDYSCVNNSMLKSHLKSHSDVHKYMCADCPYKSKYCHSMKMHLQSQMHNPLIATGGAADGGGAFIDVYGSRRGPKTKVPRKKRKPVEPKVQKTGSAGEQAAAAIALSSAAAAPPLQPAASPDPASAAANVSTTAVDPSTLANSIFQLTPLQLQSLMLLWHSTQFQQQQALNLQSALAGQPSASMATDSDEERPDDGQDSSDDEPEPELLDLSLPADRRSHATVDPALQLAATSETPKVSTHRRKSRAFKLCPDQGSENGDQPMDVESPNESSRVEQPSAVSSSCTDESPEYHDCKHCGIKFVDRVIHQLHMGYHGYNNPFECNVCGAVCRDRITFCLHLNTKAH